MSEFPVVRITLQGMEQTVCHAMTQYLVEMDADVQQAVSDAVMAFDYRGEVQRMATDAIRNAIKRAIESEFSYGNAYKAIERIAQQVAADAVRKAGDQP